jgi:hypothetical protein
LRGPRSRAFSGQPFRRFVTRTREKSGLKKLRLLVVNSYDLVLTKLTRNIDRDRKDVQAVAESEQLSFAVLKKRYEEEMRPYIADAKAKQDDLTLELWEEYFQP